MPFRRAFCSHNLCRCWIPTGFVYISAGFYWSEVNHIISFIFSSSSIYFLVVLCRLSYFFSLRAWAWAWGCALCLCVRVCVFQFIHRRKQNTTGKSQSIAKLYGFRIRTQAHAHGTGDTLGYEQHRSTYVFGTIHASVPPSRHCPLSSFCSSHSCTISTPPPTHKVHCLDRIMWNESDCCVNSQKR